MSYGVVRIRSPIKKNSEAEKTLENMRLTRVNHCTILPEDKEHKAMLDKVKDIVTWGEIEKESLVELLRERSSVEDGLSDEMVEQQTDFDDVEELAESIIDGEAEIDAIDGVKNLFRLHPPVGGYKGVKKPYNQGGSSGYRGKDINDLIDRMLGPERGE